MRFAARALAAIVAAAAISAAGGACHQQRAVPSPSSTAAAPDAADLVVRAWRFTLSPAAERLLYRQEEWTADCMRRAGFAYAPVVPPPARPGPDDPDYALVDHFLASGQDRENAATVDALDPTAALAWRTALDGPTRSADADRPKTEDPAVGGCGPTALAGLVGIQASTDAAQIIGFATEVAAMARDEPSVRQARADRVTCLRGAGMSFDPTALATDVEPFPVVREWVATAFPQIRTEPGAVRILIASDAPSAAAVEGLRQRERDLRAVDRTCGDRRDEDAAVESALRRAAADRPWGDAERRAAAAALDALESAGT